MRWYRDHPEVNFKPGPFYMRGWGKWVNLVMVAWTGESAMAIRMSRC